MFNSHKGLVESGEVTSDRFCISFFLPSVMDRSEEINQYLQNVFISPVDFDSFGLEKKTIADTVMKCLEHILTFRVRT